jgi:hypothetical protein
MGINSELLKQIKELKQELYKWEQIKGGDKRYKDNKSDTKTLLLANQKISELKSMLDELYQQADKQILKGAN